MELSKSNQIDEKTLHLKHISRYKLTKQRITESR